MAYCYVILAGDETKSTVSDTWSTDVLASDSEPPEQNQLERLEEVAEEMGRPPPFLLAPRDADSDNAFVSNAVRILTRWHLIFVFRLRMKVKMSLSLPILKTLR